MFLDSFGLSNHMAVKDGGRRNVMDILSHLENGSDTKILTEEAIHVLSSIPEGYIPLPHQIAGHKHTNGKEGLIYTVEIGGFLLSFFCLFCHGGRQKNRFRLYLLLSNLF